MTTATSRYFTQSADSHSDTASAVTTLISRNSGSTSMFQPGVIA